MNQYRDAGLNHVHLYKHASQRWAGGRFSLYVWAGTNLNTLYRYFWINAFILGPVWVWVQSDFTWADLISYGSHFNLLRGVKEIGCMKSKARTNLPRQELNRRCRSMSRSCLYVRPGIFQLGKSHQQLVGWLKPHSTHLLAGNWFLYQH